MRGGVRHILRLAECGLCCPVCEDRIDCRCASILVAWIYCVCVSFLVSYCLSFETDRAK